MENFQPTSTLMTNVVRNIIQGYGDGGEIRALAQEPVQNSKDAKHQGSNCVEVTYQVHLRKHDGIVYHLLTVSDKGTHGLRGEIFAPSAPELQGDVLPEEENWAAFEGQGFTKRSGSALGSRGQGKSAFLYHSAVPKMGDRERMAILYDTLLDDDTYRLGIRYASPRDCVLHPPWTGEDARRRVQSSVNIDDELSVCLELEPLQHVGTRVIIPYLSEQALCSIETGEFQKWLQRCWWRAIQTGSLKIRVEYPKVRTSVVNVPECWKSYNSKNSELPIGVLKSEALTEWQDLTLPSDQTLKIKRLVLKFDPTLTDDDIEDATPQFLGVQLLRGQQWITTLSSRTDFADHVPENKREGFRGFVEFDKKLERKLREECETPQHNGFNGRRSIVKDIRRIITNKVETFAEQMGWKERSSPSTTPEEEQKTFEDFISFFSPPSGPQIGLKPRWHCDLNAEYPNELSRRVDWGQSIRNVTCSVSSMDVNRHLSELSVELWVEGPHAEKNGRKIAEKSIVSWLQDKACVEFGSFQLIQGEERRGKLKLCDSGKHHLVAKLFLNHDLVATDRVTVYVHVDPPHQEPEELSIVIRTNNRNDPTSRRVNWGEDLEMEIVGVNRVANEQNLLLDASISDVALVSDVEVSLAPCPVGEPKLESSILHRSLVLQEPIETGDARLEGRRLFLARDRHRLRIDLKMVDGSPVAHNAKTIYVEMDPKSPARELPFSVLKVEDDPFPIWELDISERVLKYSGKNPIYLTLDASSSNGRSSPMSFIHQITAEGLVEYVLTLSEENPDEFENWLYREIPPGVDTELWSRMNDYIESAATIRSDVNADIGLYGRKVKDAVSIMITLNNSRT